VVLVADFNGYVVIVIMMVAMMAAIMPVMGAVDHPHNPVVVVMPPPH
jgi:hypothetical protein